MSDNSKPAKSAASAGLVGSCATAGVMTFVAPLLLLGLVFSGASIDLLGLICPLIVLLPLAGGIWGLVLLIMMVSRGVRNTKTPVSSPGDAADLPTVDGEGRML